MSSVARMRNALRTHGVGGTLRLAGGVAARTVAQPLRTWWAARYLHAAGRRFDRRFHVDTTGWIDGHALDGGANVRHATAYAGIVPRPFHKVMAQMAIDYAKFAFVDFGSGKGRALLLASEYPFAKIVGVEFSPSLHAAAQANCRTFKSPVQRCRRFELHCMDALQLELPDQPSMLFFFNPFGEELMRPLAERIDASLRRSPRKVFVVYFWPTAAKAWEGLGELVKLPVRQPDWAWPLNRQREIVAVWTTRDTDGMPTDAISYDP